jgi:hypothetical protein
MIEPAGVRGGGPRPPGDVVVPKPLMPPPIESTYVNVRKVRFQALVTMARLAEDNPFWASKCFKMPAHRDEEARLGVAQLDGAPVGDGLIAAAQGLDAALREHLPDAAVVEVGGDLGACDGGVYIDWVWFDFDRFETVRAL